MSEILSVLANNIKYYRSVQGMTQEELARRAGINRSYLAGIEAGHRNTSVKSVEKLAIALNITVADLFGKRDDCANE